MPMRPCLDCNVLLTRGTRCPACQSGRERRRGTPAQRGYGRAWYAASKRAREEQPWCSECGRTRDLTVDHVVPLARGGDGSVVRVLCRSCNSSKGARRAV